MQKNSKQKVIQIPTSSLQKMFYENKKKPKNWSNGKVNHWNAINPSHADIFVNVVMLKPTHNCLTIPQCTTPYFTDVKITNAQLNFWPDKTTAEVDFSSHVWELTWKFSLYILRSHCDNNRGILETCPYAPVLIRDWCNKDLCLCTASVSLSVKSEWTDYVILYH